MPFVLLAIPLGRAYAVYFEIPRQLRRMLEHREGRRQWYDWTWSDTLLLLVMGFIVEQLLDPLGETRIIALTVVLSAAVGTAGAVCAFSKELISFPRWDPTQYSSGEDSADELGARGRKRRNRRRP